MTAAEAREIADETIAFWRHQGIRYFDVWWAMGQRSNCGGWGRVREKMVRWLLANEYRPDPLRHIA